MSGELTRKELDRALAGDEAALARFVDLSTPVIQARVARRLLTSAPRRDVRQEVEDMTQEVFLVLFADGGRVLRSWNPEQGLSLANFVGLVAERRALSILRSGKRNPWKEDPTLDAGLDREAPQSGPEEVTASREQLRLLVARLYEELSPLGRQLFELLFIRDLAVGEVVRHTGMKPDAVYAWRSRLRRLAGRLVGELSENVPAARNNPMGGRA